MLKEHLRHCQCITNLMGDINQIKPGDINCRTVNGKKKRLEMEFV